MALTGQQLKSAMSRLRNKLNALLLPLVEYEEEGHGPMAAGLRGPMVTGPLPAEIQAAAELMGWMADELPLSCQLLREEPVRRHRHWPNVNDVKDFAKAIEGLKIEDGVRGLQNTDPLATKVSPNDDADPKTMAISQFNEQQTRLLEALQPMLRLAPGAAAPAKARRSAFLPTDSQRRVYREHVLAYYQAYIEGRDLKHKDLMLHWAAVYQAIAQRSGLRGLPFLGPEFDDFIYNYCGIAYNRSANPRGRYRTIQDLRAACLDMSQPCPQRQDFQLYLSLMVQLICGQQREVTHQGSDVPRPLT